jgi:glucose-6-phosphate isomerase, archaeal
MSLFEPARCTLHIDDGSLEGATGRYEKRLSELAGLYADEAAFEAALAEGGDRVVYAVEDFRPSSRDGDLIFGVTRMVPGKIGREYFVTRGHIHAKSNRPELYYGQKGRGLMLMESPDGETRVAAIETNSACYVPPFWIHRSVNVGDEDLVMLFAYPADSGQDYDVIARTGGMRKRVMDDGKGGWTLVDNPQYRPRSSAEVAALLSPDAR